MSFMGVLVLFSALLNASWNALAKKSGDRFAVLTWVMGFGGVMSLVFVPFVPVPPSTVWPYLAATALLQSGYTVFLDVSYKHGDLSQVYPISRGFGALLVALLSWLFAGEEMTTREWAGIAIAVMGIASLSLRPGLRFDHRAVVFPLVTGVFTAGYSIVDGLGARAMGHAFGYFVWMDLCVAPWIFLYGFMSKGKDLVTELKRARVTGFLAAVVAMLSYAIAVWAFSKGNMGKVAVLRETSVLFAAAMGSFFLKEPFGFRRIVSAVLIAVGLALARGIS